MKRAYIVIILFFILIGNVNAQRIAGIGDWVQKGRVVDVRAFGATGNGVTDDIASIRKAIRYACANQYNTLYFPHGTYKITEPIRMVEPLNIKGEGYGSRIYQTSDTHNIYFPYRTKYGDLNGSTKYYSGGDVLNGGTDDISLSLRMKWDTSTTAQDTLIAKSDAVGSIGYILYIEGGVIKASINDGTDTYTLTGNTTLLQSAVYHIAVVFDRDSGTDSKIYLDGDDDTASRTGTITDVDTITNAVNFTIGAESDGGNLTDMHVWDVRAYIGGVWSAANVQTQLENEADSSVGGTYTSYWYFDDADSATYLDDEITTNHLSFVGGTTTTYILHSKTSQSQYNLQDYRDFYLYSAATTRTTALIYMIEVSNTSFTNLIMTGNGYGFYMLGCLRNAFYSCRVNSSITSTYGLDWMVYMIDHLGKESNANVFYNLEARGGVQCCDNGVYLDGGGEGDILIDGGVFEGQTGTSIQILATIAGVRISNCHFEGGSGYGIVMSNVTHFEISNSYFTSAMYAMRFYTCKNAEIKNCYISATLGSVFADGNCDNGKLMNNTYNAAPEIYTNGWIITDSVTYAGFNVRRWDTYTKSPVNMVDGDLEAWTAAPLPIGFGTVSGSYNVTKTGTGLGDTTKLFGSYAAKITIPAGRTDEGLQVDITSVATLNRLIRPKLYNYADKNTNYSWINTTGNEYALKTVGLADPALPNEPFTVMINGAVALEDADGIGFIDAGKWAWGDAGGFNTIHVCLSDGTDPDTKTEGYVQAVFTEQRLTLCAWFYKPYTTGKKGWIAAYQTGTGVTAYPDGSYYYAKDQIGEWTKLIYCFRADPRITRLRLWFGLRGSPGDITYVDGIEVFQGEYSSPVFDSGLSADSILGNSFRVNGNLLVGGTASTMAASETFTWGSGEIFIKDPGGANRTFNPSGYFPAMAQVRVINTADAGEKITFDSTVLAEAIWPGQSATFIYSGSAWKRLGGGLTATGSDSTMTGNETFTYLTGERFIKNPGAASRTFNPSGSFPSLYEVHLVNISATYNITFDSTSLAHILTPGKGGIFIYNGSVWKCVASY